MNLEEMPEMGYTTGVNLNKSSGARQRHRYLFSTCVRGTDTMIHSTHEQPQTKKCTKCGEFKPLSDYHNFGNGIRPTCKQCTNAQNRQVYRNNRQKHLEAKRRYRAKNPDARRETLEKYEQSRKQERAAWYAVKIEIMRGNLSRAADCRCDQCGAQAEMYHHWSYDEAHWLDVTPLCRICHGKEHRVHG